MRALPPPSRRRPRETRSRLVFRAAREQALRGPALLGRERRLIGAPALPHAARERPEAREREQRGPEPEQKRVRAEARPVEHELAVPAHHEAEDLLVAPAGGDLLADLAPQVDRELGVGIGEGLVLAHEAAQLAR